MLYTGLLLGLTCAAASPTGSTQEAPCAECAAHPDASSLLQVARAPACDKSPLPLIFDNDANYDDILAFLYVARSPLFDLKAVTVSAIGFATPQGGAPSMAAIAALVGKPDVPVAFGHGQSLSPKAGFPLEWRQQRDEFIEQMYVTKYDRLRPDTVLAMTSASISGLLAPDLILKVLRESPCPVAVLATGGATNLAVAFARDPSVAGKLKTVFMMGTNYGVPGTNNVYDWQLKMNGHRGACPELGSTLESMSNMQRGDRVGCLGVNMTTQGSTEWNVFLDAFAWRSVMSHLKSSPASVRVLAANASLNMPVEADTFDAFADALADPRLRLFTKELAKRFLGAGEARWWDAELAVLLADEVGGARERCGPVVSAEECLCANWADDRRTSVSLVWRSSLAEGEVNPYGSVYDDANADAPPVSYCLRSNPDRMWEQYWPVVNGTSA
uniref:Inosine/uridine-preferring nucleoside hydrolase domain-containing protein n=1 Tax=Zooxanthella nutricula TaxID=1333877 RepID=A0A6U6KCL2_9DINO|mmetsp:Transcript_27451/g.82747  ORF Transcript_27451/g.82747 Transcript_27451/m.82747 type:complete len:443 (+) Transcript_27451:76-1404(+)